MTTMSSANRHAIFVKFSEKADREAFQRPGFFAAEVLAALELWRKSERTAMNQKMRLFFDLWVGQRKDAGNYRSRRVLMDLSPVLPGTQRIGRYKKTIHPHGGTLHSEAGPIDEHAK
ncbi:UNVERIFIED_CONTAM: hypothetical protein Sradi_5607800 [Sesamum radiatum]|uniref:Uncharacterized protein n=1 Tax=Sesamum radiatum TaxID=300843 RepID=A0AAW2L1I2_SESRA